MGNNCNSKRNSGLSISSEETEQTIDTPVMDLGLQEVERPAKAHQRLGSSFQTNSSEQDNSLQQVESETQLETVESETQLQKVVHFINYEIDAKSKLLATKESELISALKAADERQKVYRKALEDKQTETERITKDHRKEIEKYKKAQLGLEVKLAFAIMTLTTNESVYKRLIQEYKVELYQQINANGKINAQLDYCQEEFVKRDATIEKMQEDHEAALAQIKEEHESQLVQIREDHETELSRIREDHDSELARIQEDQKAELAQICLDHQSEQDKIKNDLETELAKIKSKQIKRNSTSSKATQVYAMDIQEDHTPEQAQIKQTNIQNGNASALATQVAQAKMRQQRRAKSINGLLVYKQSMKAEGDIFTKVVDKKDQLSTELAKVKPLQIEIEEVKTTDQEHINTTPKFGTQTKRQTEFANHKKSYSDTGVIAKRLRANEELLAGLERENQLKNQALEEIEQQLTGAYGQLWKIDSKKVPYDQLVLQAVAENKQPDGSSLLAIWNHVKANRKEATDSTIKDAVKRLLKGGKLDKINYSFKLSEYAKQEGWINL